MGVSGPEHVLLSPTLSVSGEGRLVRNGKGEGSRLLTGSVGVVLFACQHCGPPQEVQRLNLKDWMLDALGDVRLEGERDTQTRVCVCVCVCVRVFVFLGV
jgi:hypothetical protein